MEREQIASQLVGKARAELQRGTGWWPLQPKPCAIEPPWEPYDPNKLTRWDFMMNRQWQDPWAGRPHLLPECEPTNVPDLRAIVVEAFSDDQSIGRAEQLLQSFASFTHPVSFEVVGRGPWPIFDMQKAEKLSAAGHNTLEDAIIGHQAPYTAIQFVTHHTQTDKCCQLIRMHYPQTKVVVEDCNLSTNLQLGQHIAVREGGEVNTLQHTDDLSERKCFASTLGLWGMHCFPLRTFGQNDPDPIRHAVAGMEGLKPGKWAMLQIVFQPTKNPWAKNCREAVSHASQPGRRIFEPRELQAIRDKFTGQLFAVSARLLAATEDDFEALKEWCSQFVNPATEVLQQTVDDEAEFRRMGTEFLSSPMQSLVATMNDIDDAEALSQEQFFLQLASIARCAFRPGILLNTRELATLAHLPGSSVIRNFQRLRLRKASPPAQTRRATARPASAAASRIPNQDTFIRITCNCGKRLKAKQEHVGKRSKCPVCGAIIIIPNCS
ncbi:MAG: hypothetical protein R6U98_10000 [Pirellulaceae bacterium]